MANKSSDDTSEHRIIIRNNIFRYFINVLELVRAKQIYHLLSQPKVDTTVTRQATNFHASVVISNVILVFLFIFKMTSVPFCLNFFRNIRILLPSNSLSYFLSYILTSNPVTTDHISH